MKKVVMRRFWESDRGTLGSIKIRGVDHKPLFTCENPLRQTPKDSRIPAGVYTCRPYSSSKYPHVYEVMNVPGRTGILFHWGNTERDTQGCILLGLGAGAILHDPAVFTSRPAVEKFRELIGDEEFELTIFDTAQP